MKAYKIKLAKRNGTIDKLYKNAINQKIRAKYSLDDELAILRQRDTKQEEFEEYNTFVEDAKAQAKAEIESPETESFTVDRVLTRSEEVTE